MRDEPIPPDAQRIDTLIRAVYACISGAAGEPRDWDRFRALHRPEARSLRTVIDADGKPRAESFGVEDYIANVAPFFAQNAFFEVETAQRIERFGQVAHVWSRYEARTEPDGGALLKRGANSIQLFHDGARWWIVSTILGQRARRAAFRPVLANLGVSRFCDIMNRARMRGAAALATRCTNSVSLQS